MTEKASNIPGFAHLHLHSQYSLLDGAIRLKPLFERAKAYGMDSVAITDHGTMFGALDFFEYANKAGVKPIIGCECYVAPRKLTDKTAEADKDPYHLVLLAQNNEGYRNLCRLASIAQLKGFYYKPRIDREVLAEFSKGIIALSACLKGEVPQRILEGKMEQAEETARFYQSIFGEDNFFLEVQSNGLSDQDKVNTGIFDLSKRLSIPVVSTNDCHYLDKKDVRAHEVLLCIQTGKTVNDTSRFKFNTDQLYFKSREEMFAPFSDHPEIMEQTVEIAKRCNVDFDFNTYHFPKFDNTSEKTADEIFDEEVWAGFEKKMAVIKHKNPSVDVDLYKARLEYETGVIKNMGFPGYFLIVADFIRYSKQNGIPVGPGRGSAAGSMVAYVLDITGLDPIEHGLIFERFLNPSRISMPDIDVDFCINGREKVYEYVVKRYGGGDYVSQIITYGTLKTKAVLRDVGRALDIPLREVDELAKFVPDKINISLKEALEEAPEILQRAENRSDIQELLEISKVLEGLPRHASVHAAGVVIGDKPLYEYLPLFKGKNGEVVTQFDMKRVEQIGLVKFDFLGLRNLTVIQNALDMISAQGKTPPDLLDLDFNDPDSYELLAKGDTTGVFQLESSGMKDLLRRMKPANFAEITALVALYRPGPLDSGMVDDFVECKHGRKPVNYLLPELEPLLKETYGVIVYQEQVMHIASVLANYSMADADGLRKAMGKKIPEMMAKHRDLFLKGAAENKLNITKAGQLFDLMEKFGGYGFNKSHSAAYALIAFQTAFLKAHYPVEFMAALLSSEMGSIDGVVKFMAECRAHGIEVLQPDINYSETDFRVFDGKIRFGMVAVKNAGAGAIEAIIEERKKNGPFKTIFEFCSRVDLRKVNKRVLEALIKAGAFDCTGARRSQLMTVLEEALEYGQRVQKEKSDPQLGLFKIDKTKSSLTGEPQMPDTPDWDERFMLSLEKETLGFYVSGHPLDRFRFAMESYGTTDTSAIREVSANTPVRIGGTVQASKVIRTKRGDQMAFVNLEDMQGTVEVTVFSSVFEQVAGILYEDSPIMVEGVVQGDENGVKILAEKIILMEKAHESWPMEVHLGFSAEVFTKKSMEDLRTILKKYPGNSKTYLHIIIPGETETVIELGNGFSLSPVSELKEEINNFSGTEAVSVIVPPPVKKPETNGFRRKKAPAAA